MELVDVGGGVLVDLFLRQSGTSDRSPRRVADLGGVVAEDQDRGVSPLLELAELAQHHREAEVDVGGGGIDAELHPERAALLELLLQLGLADELVVSLVEHEVEVGHRPDATRRSGAGRG